MDISPLRATTPTGDPLIPDGSVLLMFRPSATGPRHTAPEVTTSGALARPTYVQLSTATDPRAVDTWLRMASFEEDRECLVVVGRAAPHRHGRHIAVMQVAG
jgi:hypothetical protein